MNARVPRRGAVVALLAFAAAATAPLPAQQNVPPGMVHVVIRWSGQNAPTMVNRPNGAPFAKQQSYFEGTLPLPVSGVAFQDLDVNFGDESYPLRLRLYPSLQDVDLAVAFDQLKSCADVYLKRLEKPTLTEIASVRAAFTLNQLIGRAGENSCDRWPLRAEKARYDRYYNAMERSDVLVIPDAVKSSYLNAAGTGAARDNVEKVIAAGDEAEHRRYAVSVQRVVLAATQQRNWSVAYKASAELLQSSQQPQLAAPIAKEIDAGALAKQTTDLAIRAGVELPPPHEP
jgi:hypothetical protein